MIYWVCLPWILGSFKSVLSFRNFNWANLSKIYKPRLPKTVWKQSLLYPTAFSLALSETSLWVGDPWEGQGSLRLLGASFRGLSVGWFGRRKTIAFSRVSPLLVIVYALESMICWVIGWLFTQVLLIPIGLFVGMGVPDVLCSVWFLVACFAVGFMASSFFFFILFWFLFSFYLHGEFL